MRCYFNLYEVYSLLVNRKLLIMYIPIFKEREHEIIIIHLKVIL